MDMLHTVEFFLRLIKCRFENKRGQQNNTYSQLLYGILIVIIRHSKRQYWCAKHNDYSICTFLNTESSNLTFSSYKKEGRTEKKDRVRGRKCGCILYLSDEGKSGLGGWRQQLYPLNNLMHYH
jgi:hypothetical protein